MKTKAPEAEKTTTKAEFMKARIDWSPLEALKLPTEWIGADLFVRLDDERRVVVSLKTHGCEDHYEKLLVRVLNKREGAVDEKSFRFREYLGGIHRKDSHPNREAMGYEVVAYVSWDWYIAVPETTAPLVEAVAAYVAMFR